MNKSENSSDDLSQQAISLAREIDRLPFGQKYVINLEKPGTKGRPWEVTINLEQTIRRWKIEKR